MKFTVTLPEGKFSGEVVVPGLPIPEGRARRHAIVDVTAGLEAMDDVARWRMRWMVSRFKSDIAADLASKLPAVAPAHVQQVAAQLAPLAVAEVLVANHAEMQAAPIRARQAAIGKVADVAARLDRLEARHIGTIEDREPVQRKEVT